LSLAPDDDAILSLALAGSRAPGFQHDVAGKLQTLVTALEEIEDRSAVLADTELNVAVACAREAVHDLTKQLQAYRALTRRSRASLTPVRILIERAAERAGVKIRGEVPAIEVTVPLPEAIQATALLLDGAAGKSVPREVTVAFDERGFTLPRGASAESVAVASYVYRRDGGDVRATDDALAVIWPTTS
jgi:hypothetical protein